MTVSIGVLHCNTVTVNWQFEVFCFVSNSSDQVNSEHYRNQIPSNKIIILGLAQHITETDVSVFFFYRFICVYFALMSWFITKLVGRIFMVINLLKKILLNLYGVSQVVRTLLRGGGGFSEVRRKRMSHSYCIFPHTFWRVGGE